ncbi:MAG: hypothetical protein ACREOD_03445 [Candidatus Dormibacteria bacterium]
MLDDPGRRLRELDGLTADARSLLRRAGRLRQRLADLSEPGPVGPAQELLGAAERLLAALEETRQLQRRELRRGLRGGGDQDSAR